MDTPHDAVVVGVGSDGYGAALLFAVAEARRSRRPLHLVHVLELPPGAAYEAANQAGLQRARTTLAEALRNAATLGATGATGEVVESGWLVDDLVRGMSVDQLLVLQHRAFTRVHRIFTGSVVQSVAARAPAPVVSIREGWTPRSGGTAVVTVAVQDPGEAPELLRRAFEEARARDAALIVLHAWWLASGFDVLVVDDSYRSAWTDHSLEEIEPVLAPLRAEFSDVEVTVEVRHSSPLEAVLDASAESELLVLGRRHHLLPAGSHLGPVTRGALDHASAPVLIAPELAVATAASTGSSLHPGRAGLVLGPQRPQQR